MCHTLVSNRLAESISMTIYSLGHTSHPKRTLTCTPKIYSPFPRSTADLVFVEIRHDFLRRHTFFDTSFEREDQHLFSIYGYIYAVFFWGVSKSTVKKKYIRLYPVECEIRKKVMWRNKRTEPSNAIKKHSALMISFWLYLFTLGIRRIVNYFSALSPYHNIKKLLMKVSNEFVLRQTHF